jgi:tripartite-type tricarboxylate transporter receptor subunit TctC
MEWKGLKMKGLVTVCMLFLFMIAGSSLSAEEYPTKPINIVITHPAAGSINNSLRMLATSVEKTLGQPFVITNNGGGAGSVALTQLARQKPDGYHLVGCASSALVRIPQFRSVSYKLTDFVPVLHIGTLESGLFVKADSPFKTLKDMVEYARKNPGKVTYAVTGTGQPMHIAMEYIAKQEGIQWTAVPYSGEDPMIPLLGGHVTATSAGAVNGIHVKSGKARYLVTHGEKRLKDFPNVPTMRDLGYDFINESVILLAAPKDTPLPIIKKLDDAFHKAMDDPEFVKYMESAGNTVNYRNAADTQKYLKDNYDRLGKMIKDLKIPQESEKK